MFIMKFVWTVNATWICERSKAIILLKIKHLRIATSLGAAPGILPHAALRGAGPVRPCTSSSQ
jgi:hypothetical protein